jgi:hypothetical protein
MTTHLCRRLLSKYNPLADAARRWPNWLLAATALNGLAEIISAEGKLILLDVAQWPDAETAFAHALAHLDLGHHTMPADPAHEAEADWLASIRLDREGSRQV